MPKPILVVAGTDFQDPLTSYMDTDDAGHGDYTVQTARTKAILTKIKEAYGDAYGFLAGGDYNFDEIKESEERTSYGVRKVLEAVTDVFGPEIRSVIVHGNHDAVVPEMSPSGANDTPYYGVFVMRENEYRSYPLIPRKWPDWEQSEAIAAKLAGELEEYLAEKAAAGYDKPVFIASHAPLHFNTRTKDKGDAIYADRFFAVIRQYAEQLNILFLR